MLLVSIDLSCFFKHRLCTNILLAIVFISLVHNVEIKLFYFLDANCTYFLNDFLN